MHFYQFSFYSFILYLALQKSFLGIYQRIDYLCFDTVWAKSYLTSQC